VLICGKAAQGPQQQLLRSGLLVMGASTASTTAINTTQGTIQGACDFTSFRLRWNARSPTNTGWIRVWFNMYTDVQVPMPFYLPSIAAATDVLFFNGPF
jgi:hypothetical protein